MAPPQSAAADDSAPDAFPCKLTIALPLPTPRLASAALRAVSVDPELSPLVRRRSAVDGAVLRTEYAATTNRMLRVAVNGFMESVALALQVMEELDADVVHGAGLEGLERVQGVEQGVEGDAGRV